MVGHAWGWGITLRIHADDCILNIALTKYSYYHEEKQGNLVLVLS
jgi:hypothetical protein